MIQHNSNVTRAIPFSGCVLHRIHLPRPVRTHLHHVFPQFLQLRKWGEVRDRRTVKVCSTGHDDTHHALNVLLGVEGMLLPGVGRKEKALAYEAVRLYQAA